MAHNHRTPRHLDDPLRPFYGLTIPQWGGVFAGIAATLVVGSLIGPLHLVLQVALFVAGLPGMAVFLAVYTLADDRQEPFARQLGGYLRRPHRYAPPREENG
jgi:hypothetical protein